MHTDNVTPMVSRNCSTVAVICQDMQGCTKGKEEEDSWSVHNHVYNTGFKIKNKKQKNNL